MERIEGVMIFADGMILISDIETILSLAEATLNEHWEELSGLGAEARKEVREECNEL
jgi:hypothetical protein